MLRLLLALVLLANGIGSAFAATRMQVEGFGARAAAVAMAQSDASTGAAHCDEHAGMDAVVMDASAMSSHAPGDAQDSDSDSGDCCASGFCLCACVQLVLAGIENLHMLESAVTRDTTAQVLSIGHAAPALPHLIRPPIG
ncbi:MAG: CopL family metal-binding regulatory protein [Luteimonas sp.]